MGKTLAAEVIGFETGKPLKVVNCGELVSKWVGETGKNIEAIFEEAKTLDCVSYTLLYGLTGPWTGHCS